MTDLLRAAAEAALQVLMTEPLASDAADKAEEILAEALASDHSRGATEMIDDRLRIERLVRANARRAMVIDIIERLIEDPEREDFGPSDMEYWNPLHDALQAKLRAALAEPEEPADDVWFEDRNGACRKSPKDCQRFGANGVPEAVWVNGKRYGLTDEEALRAISPDLYHHIEGAERETRLADARHRSRAEGEEP